MARCIHTVLELSGQLVARSPIHVGGAMAGLVVDMPAATDGLGRHYLPGTAMAGAIRQWTETRLPDLPWKDFWGSSDDTGAASLILVDDAPRISRSDDAPAELWHGVGLDRFSGAAGDKIKYDREVLPAGSRFVFRFQIEARSEDETEQARQVLGRLGKALEDAEVAFGAGSTRGLGQVMLENAVGRETAWHSRQGVLDFLKGMSPDVLPQWRERAATLALAAADHIGIVIHWSPRGPLMSKAACDGLGVDHLPFVSAVDGGKMAMTLSGAGIKGALRSHGERIVRTVLNLGLPEDSGNRTHRDQLNVPLVNGLFGSPRPPSKRRGQQQTNDPPGAKGALSAATCYATSGRKTAAEWSTLADTENTQDLPNRESECWEQACFSLQRAYHLAVDRWTGGAAENFLYSAVEPMGTAWEPIRMELKTGSDDDQTRFALVWLLLKEMAAGRIPLGFGANRGYGEVEVRAVTLEGARFGNIQLDGSLDVPEGPFKEWLEQCAQAWKNWIESPRDQQEEAPQ